MSADKAGEIIRRAMADRSVYDAMAVKTKSGERFCEIGNSPNPQPRI